MRFITNIPSGGGGGGVGPAGPPGPAGPAGPPGPSYLQAAYDGGNTILMNDAKGAISFLSDAGSTLSLLSLVTDVAASGAALFVNNVGTGNGIQIQDNGVDVFVVDLDGAINLNANNDGTSGSKIALVAGTGVTGDGGGVTIDAGVGGSAGDGGQVDIQSGRAGAAGQVSGEIRIFGAVQLFATGAAAFITIRGGERTHAGSAISAGAVNILGGDTAGAGASAGAVNITGGTASSTAAGGDVVITGGTSVGGAQGGVNIFSSRAVAAGGAALTITQSGVPAGIFVGSVDPAAGAGVVGTEGSLFLRDAGASGALYIKTGALATDWSLVSTGGGGTLQNAYDAGGGAIFLTGVLGPIDLRTSDSGTAGLNVTMEVGSDGDAVNILHQGATGKALVVNQQGLDDTLSVSSSAGTENININSVGDVVLRGGVTATSGRSVTILGGAGTVGAGGNVALNSGAGVGGVGGTFSAAGGAGPVGFNGGPATLTGGAVTNPGTGGATTVSGGVASGGGSGGALAVRGGAIVSGAGTGGAATFGGGSVGAGATGTGGTTLILGGDVNNAAGGAGGALTLRGGGTQSTTAAGGTVDLTGGAAGASSGAGGSITISGGASLTGQPGATTISTPRGASTGAVTADGPVLTLTQSGTSGATVSMFAGTADPSSGSGVVANEGSLYLRDAGTAGSAYLKTGAAATAWTVLATGGAAPLNNLTATVPPTAANDSTQGYSIGSLWMDDEGGSAGTVGNGVWVARSVAVGLADWRRFEALNQTAGGAAPTSSEDANDGYSVGSLWLWPGVGTWVATNVSTGGLGAWSQLSASGPQVIQTGFDTATNTVGNGQLGYLTTTANRVQRAIATSLAASRAFGANEGVSGSMVTDGTIAAQTIEAAITIAAGDVLYLSAVTAGAVTNVAPVTVTQVVLVVGYARTAGTGAGGTVPMVLQVGTPILL